MILIGPLSSVDAAIIAHGPSHLISLLDPETMIETPPGIAPERHLKLGINDVTTSEGFLAAPAHDHVQQIIDFSHNWAGAQGQEEGGPLLVHCWAGISRSTATAFIALCALNDHLSELALARMIRAEGAHAHPNLLMVALADELLGRRGRMCAAVEALGPGRVTWEGRLFSVPARPEADAL